MQHPRRADRAPQRLEPKPPSSARGPIGPEPPGHDWSPHWWWVLAALIGAVAVEVLSLDLGMPTSASAPDAALAMADPAPARPMAPAPASDGLAMATDERPLEEPVPTF